MPAQHPPSKRLKVLLLGYGCIALNLLEGLLETPEVDLVGVFRWSQRTGKKWEGSDEHEQAVGRLIKSHGLREVKCPGANSYEMVALLKELQPDILMMGTWGEILKPHILELPNIQFINCHPSLLPLHRGPNPYVSAIACDESLTGVTFHRVNAAIDDGPILLQEALPIGSTDTGGDLQRKCGRVAKQQVGHLIRLLLAKPHWEGTPQASDQASYFPALQMQWGNIQWDEDPHQVCCWVRAYRPWLESYSFIDTPFPFAKGLMVIIDKLTMEPVAPPLIPSSDKLSSSTSPVPGQVLWMKGGRIGVASNRPDTQFVIEIYRLFAGYKRLELGVLPATLSRWVGAQLIRCGQVFYNGAPRDQEPGQTETPQEQ